MFDHPKLTKFLLHWMAGKHSQDEVREMASVLVKYDKQLPSIAADLDMEWYPTPEQLIAYSEEGQGVVTINIDDIQVNEGSTTMMGRKLEVMELFIDSEARIRLDYKVDWETQKDLKADMRNAKAHYMWQPESKFWHIPSKPFMVKRAIAVLQDHGFETKPLDVFALSPPLEGEMENWFHWNQDEIGVAVSYHADEFREALKELPIRRWDKRTKRWWVPIHQVGMLVNLLERFGDNKAAGFLMASENIEAWSQNDAVLKIMSNATSLQDFAPSLHALDGLLDDMTPPGLKLYPFQKAAVAFMEITGGKCLIGDEMGCGKTIEAIMWAIYNGHKTLIVAPASLKQNWANELRTWAPYQSVCLYYPKATQKFIKQMANKEIEVVTKEDDIPEYADFVVINYKALEGKQFKNEDGYNETKLNPYAEKLVSTKFEINEEEGTFHNFEAVIFDECHYLKNHKAQRTLGALEVAQRIGQVIAMSGTPILSRPIEFFTTLKLLKGSEFGNWLDFVQTYCDAIEGEYGWEIRGSSNLDDLNFKLRSCMIRRTKDQVLHDLPAKISQLVEVVPDKISAYHTYAKQRIKDLKHSDANHLILINDLRQKAAEIKAPQVAELATNVIGSEGCVVVFFHHHAVADFIEEHFKKEKISYKRLDGKTDMTKRQGIVDGFQEGDFDALLCSTLAAGQGITLTRASRVIFAEREWVPAWEVQAEDRLHRIGQKKVVHALYVHAMDTIDEVFDDAIIQKKEVLAATLDGKEATSILVPMIMADLKGRYS